MIALIPHCGFLSETSRMLHIGRALQRQGCEVAMATHGGPYTRVLDEAGMRYTLLEPAMDAVRCTRYVADVVQIGRPGLRLQPADEVRRGVAAEVAFLRGCGARMVVIGFTLTAYLSSRVVGIALAASHGGSYVPPVFERKLAPVPTTMPMPGMEWLPSAVKRAMANSGPQRLKGPVRFLNEIATELGVEPVPTLAALMLGDLTLVTDVPEVLGVERAALEAWRPPRAGLYRPGTRLTYVGPMFARLDLPVPESVVPFLDGSRPTAYVALSSSTPAMLQSVVEQVRLSNLRVIVGATIHDWKAPAHPDVVVGGVMPSHLIMPRVDVAVTMGGQGSVQTAMASGTPLVGIPLHPEQELNVDLAVRRGMAMAIAPRHAGTPRMAAAVQRIVADARFKEAALRVQRCYAGIDGAANAAAAIVRHLHADRVGGATSVRLS
jgi:UDP:flavonoid glycosyltransferase YjiC (YdhE family)